MDRESLIKEHAERGEAIRRALRKFRKEGKRFPRDSFYELCFCLLTPQSSAFRCHACVTELEKRDFLNQGLSGLPGLAALLRNYTRFHTTKAKHLLLMKDGWEKTARSLQSLSAPAEKRAFLVRNVKGLGMKEASHFLRNTGHTNLAILDRHILRHLAGMGIIPDLLPSLTEKRYLEIERRFLAFSEDIGIPMDELDLTFWSHETGKVFK